MEILPKREDLNFPTVSNIRAELLNDTLSLYEDLYHLYDLAGISRRPTRGLFDAVGEGFKFLFGSMSNSDAADIRQTLTNIDRNEHSITNHNKALIHLIDELNESNKILRANQNKEKALIEKHTEILNSLAVSLDHERVEHALLATQASISRLINSIRSEISMLHYSTLFLKAGILDSFVLSRKEIATAVSRANVGYTINDTEVDSLLTTNPLNVITNILQKTIIIIIPVPITFNETANYYHITGVPQRVNQKMAIINDPKSFLIISHDNQTFWTGNTLIVHRFGHITIGQIPNLWVLKENVTCESNIFQYSSDYGCRYKEWCENETINRITNNGYMITTYKNETLNYTCDTTQGYIQLHDAMLLEYTGNCSFTNDHIVIKPRLIKPDIILRDFIANPHCCDILNHNYSHIKSLPLNFNFKELKFSDSEIRMTKTMIDNFHLTQYQTIGYTISPLLLLLAVVFAFIVVQRRRATRGRIIIDEHVNNLARIATTTAI